MDSRVLQEWRGVVEREENEPKQHCEDLGDGGLDDDGHEDAVARGGSGTGALSTAVRGRDERRRSMGGNGGGGMGQHSLHTTWGTDDTVHEVPEELAVVYAPESRPNGVFRGEEGRVSIRTIWPVADDWRHSQTVAVRET